MLVSQVAGHYRQCFYLGPVRCEDTIETAEAVGVIDITADTLADYQLELEVIAAIKPGCAYCSAFSDTPAEFFAVWQTRVLGVLTLYLVQDEGGFQVPATKPLPPNAGDQVGHVGQAFGASLLPEVWIEIAISLYRTAAHIDL